MRLTNLDEAGWPRIAGAKGQWVRNCPPPFVFVGKGDYRSLRACNEWRVCPWCWARMVGETWDRLIGVFYAEPMDRHVRLVDGNPIRYRLAIRLETEFQKGSLSPEKALGRAAAQVHMLRRVFSKHGLGSFHITTVGPSSKKNWKIFTRVMVLVPEAYSLPKEAWDVGDVIESRRGLIARVVKFASYPREAMFGDPGMMSDLLTIKAPFRFRECTGVFRGQLAKREPDGELQTEPAPGGAGGI